MAAGDHTRRSGVDMPRRALALPLVVLAALAASGCGEPSAVAVPPGQTIRIVLDEYRLDPQNVRVRAGRITLVAVDRGRLVHNLVIEPIPRDPGATPKAIRRTKTLHPGETSPPVSVTLRPGRYR